MNPSSQAPVSIVNRRGVVHSSTGPKLVMIGEECIPVYTPECDDNHGPYKVTTDDPTCHKCMAKHGLIGFSTMSLAELNEAIDKKWPLIFAVTP